MLLQAHLQLRGDEDVGPALRVSQEAGAVLYTHRRLRTRSLKKDGRYHDLITILDDATSEMEYAHRVDEEGRGH